MLNILLSLYLGPGVLLDGVPIVFAYASCVNGGVTVHPVGATTTLFFEHGPVSASPFTTKLTSGDIAKKNKNK
mgnify:FL=1